jgi:adenylate cyclase
MFIDKISGLFKELRRRHVVRVTLAYAVIGWVVIEVADLLTEAYNAPDWILQVFIALIALGLPLSAVLAWAFELTPEGIVYDEGADEPGKPPKPKTLINDSSIAVLPLDYYGESEKEYIAEGITEDLTTLLSRTPGLFVIARNSSSRYRGGNTSICKVGEELGVRYVAEGSVRRMGDQLRVNVQLIEASSENHVWAQRFDFAESDLFEIEMDICQRVAAQLVSSLEKAESDRSRIMPAGTQNGWLLTQRAIHVWWSGPDEETVGEAFELITAALEQDPEYAYALAFYGFLCIISLLMGINRNAEDMQDKGMQAIQAALKTAPNDPFVLFYWGVIQGFTGNMERAINTLERAKVGNPNDPHIQADLSFFLSQMGRDEEARKLLESAFLLSPYEPRSYVWHFYKASALGFSEMEAALLELEKSISLFNRYIPSLTLKIIYCGAMGREDEARETAATLRKHHPKLTLADLSRMLTMATVNKENLDITLEIVTRYFVNGTD